MIERGKQALADFGKNHTLYTGTIIPEIVEKIGSGIDFAIIDTFHLVPCEILDFIGVFPFLAPNAMVVLHDVGKNMRDLCRAEATKVLFDSVVADKYYNWDSEEHPNIAGFQINDETEKYISNVILSLGITWGYDSGERIINSYGKLVKKYYSSELYQIYQNICKKSIYTLSKRSELLK